MVRDAAGPVYDHFASLTLGRLRDQDIGRLVEIHRRSPWGPHPDELARLLYFLRARDVAGKYVIVSLPGAGWRLGTVTGHRSDGSVAFQPGVYRSAEEAEHAVFRMRLAELGLIDTLPPARG